MAGLKMLKPIRLVGVCAFAGAAIFVAAQLASTSHRSSMLATTTPTVSPLETITVNDELLPADFWDAS